MYDASPSSFQIVNQWLHLLIPILDPQEMADTERIVTGALDRMAGELDSEYGQEVAEDLAQFGVSVLGRSFWSTDLGMACIHRLWQEDDEPITFRQAAALMDVSLATVQRELARGNLARCGSAVSRASVGRWMLEQASSGSSN